MMRPRHWPLPLALSLLAGVVGGQEAPPSPEPKDKTEDTLRYREELEVEAELPAILPSEFTALKTALAVESTPASVSVVPTTVLKNQDAFVLGDALRNVSGVNVASGFGVFDFFLVRGFDSLSSGLILTDGAPEPEATFYPVYNLRQVEVLKGPGAYLYGGGPLSGAVHLVRKQPAPARFGDVSVSYGSFRAFDGTLDANLGRADGSLGFRLNALYHRADGYRDATERTMLALNPAFQWRPSGATRLVVNLEYVRPRFQPDVGLPVLGALIAPVPRTRSYQSPLDLSDQDLYRLRLDFERRFSQGFRLRNKLYYTDLEWKSDGTLFAGAFPGPTGAIGLARSLVLLDDRQKLFGNQLEGVFSFSTGSIRHSLLAGVEVSRLGDRFTQDVGLLPTIDVFAPVETAREPVFIVPGLSQVGDSRSIVLAPYVVDRMELSERVQFFAGGRLDVVDFEDPATSTSRGATRCNPLFGVVLAPRAGLSLYANGGTAFSPPSSQVVGEREPEHSVQVEVGAKKTFLKGRGFATLAFYHLAKDNIAIPDATGFTRQNGDARSRGLEVELSAEATKGWFTYLSYGFNDAELTRFNELVLVSFQPPAFALLDRSGNDPAFAPRHIFNLWTTKEFRNGLSLAAGARYVSRQFIAEENAFAIDDYLLLDAMVAFKRGRWRCSLNLKNLTDRDYETRGFSSTSVLPADPFTIHGRIEVALGSR